MSLNTTDAVHSLITNEIATAIAIACGDVRMIPIVRNIANDVSTKFTTHTNAKINEDLQTNIGGYAGASKGLFNNLNTNINNISSVELTSLTDQYVDSGVAASLSNTLINTIYTSIISNNSITLPRSFTQQLITRTLAPLTTNVVQSAIGNVVAGFIDNAYSNHAASTVVSTINDALGSVIDSVVNGDIEDLVNNGFINIPDGGGFDFGGDFSEFTDNYVDKFIDEFQTSIVKDSFNFSNSFVPFNDENNKKLKTVTQGFVDPSATYPSVDYQGISETNKLAQGIVEGTIVQEKFNSRMVGARLPDGDSFSEPVSSYKGKYPFNKVTETISGHTIEIDDTPGAERIHVYHKSGTYYEIDALGNTFHRSHGSEYNIIDRNGYLSITGTGSVSVGGNLNIMVSGNAHIEVTGDAVLNGYNDVEINAAGRLQLTAGEAIDMRAPKIYIEADKQLHVTADEYARMELQKLDVLVHTTTTITNEDNIEITSKKNIHILTTEDFQVKSAANIVHETADKMSHKATTIAQEASETISNKAATITTNSSGNINTTASGVLNSHAGGNYNVDASNVFINSGNSSSVVGLDSSTSTTPAIAEEADYSEAGLIEFREDFVNINISDAFPDNFIDENAYHADDVGDVETSKKIQEELIKNGMARQSDFEETPIESKIDKSAQSSIIQRVKPDPKLASLDILPPDNFMLSPHFTLGMLSTLAPAQPNKVKAQKGLSIGQIIYNLADVALNVLEPLYASYPNMYVTSGFRNEEDSRNSNSVHPYGLAVDIQFRGIAKYDYFNIAKNIKDLLNGYDQLLLEYRNTGNATCWIHIGIKNQTGQQRNQIMTYNNHSKHSDGLVQLSYDNKNTNTA